MRIGLNLIYALPETGGGWNYAARLLEALAKYDTENSYIAFVTKANESLVPKASNFETALVKINARSRITRIIYEQTMLQIRAKKYRLDCLHSLGNTQPLFNLVPTVVTIHDLYPFMDFAVYGFIKSRYTKFMIARAAKNADALATVSKATSDSIFELLKIDNKKTTVVRVIMAPLFKPSDDEIAANLRKRYNLPKKFWLYVAHQFFYKNHLNLLRSYHHLKSEGVELWPLVLRGDERDATASIKETIQSLGLQKDVTFLPRLTEEELPQLYTAATALVFPSLYEGGGIPVVEAMACGCPVIASGIPPVKEFAKDAALYFDGNDYLSIADAIKTFQEDENLREDYRSKGLIRAEQFRPEQVVKNQIAAYQMAVNHKRQEN